MVDSPHRHPARDGTRPRGPMTGNIEGGKGSVFYRAHSYHTKVPVEGLIQLLSTTPILAMWCLTRSAGRVRRE